MANAYARVPDTVLVAVTRADGGVTVLRVITKEYAPDPAGGRMVVASYDPTPEYITALIAEFDWQGPLAPVSWRIVPDDYVDENTDRYFRNAFKDSGGGKPDVDMPKAREIHRNVMRMHRRFRFVGLDAEYDQADEANDQAKKRDIGLLRKALRDVTVDPAIEAAQTPEELKAVWPAFLGENRTARRFDNIRAAERASLARMRNVPR